MKKRRKDHICTSLCMMEESNGKLNCQRVHGMQTVGGLLPSFNRASFFFIGCRRKK